MKQRGMALLMVLLLLAVMATLAVVMTERWFFSFSYGVQLRQRLQGKWHAVGAEAVAGALLRLDETDDPWHTHLSQRWATVAGRHFPLQDAGIRLRLKDARACFNLNAVVGDEAVQNIFTRLLMLLGEEPQRALGISAALADWLDADAATRQNGAEDEEYASRLPPYLTAGQNMQDVSELRQVRGVDAGLLQRLRPLVCALPDNSLRININTLVADQWPLLAALSDERNEAESRQLLLLRPASGWVQLEQPLATATSLASGVRYLALNSDYFHLFVTVHMADSQYRQYSLLQRHKNQITVLRRHREDEE